jgi:hypothetical protein
MPRARRTQTPQTPGLEAGAAYGEVSDSLEAQQAIPLPQKQPGGQLVLPEQVATPAMQPPAQPGPLPLAEAQAFTPQITPLTAPGTGMSRGVPRQPPTPNQEAALLLRDWGQATGDAALLEAAAQLSL